MITRKRKEDVSTGTDMGRMVAMGTSSGKPPTTAQGWTSEEMTVPDLGWKPGDALEAGILDGNALLDQAAAHATLDPYLDRSPKVGQPIDYPAMVALLQRKRQMFIDAESKKKEPKENTENG